MKKWTLSVSVFLCISATGLFLTECGDSNLGTGQGDAAAGCPINPPTTGTACSLPSGTMCNNYPQPGCACCAGGGGYECVDGKWEQLAVANGVAPGFACPSTVPEAGTACSANPCGGSQPACSYDCTTGNGTASTATCENGSWSIQQLGLACAIDAGDDASDAGDGGD